MGVDLCNVLQLYTGHGQKLMADAESRGAHHGELMLLKQRVDRAHRAVGAVFNGQHAEFAQAGLHRGHHRVKGLDIQDAAARQQAVAGDLRVRALHALTGNKSGLWENRPARGEGFLHPLSHSGRQVHQLRLPRARQLKERGVEVIGVALLVTGLGCYLGKNFALALLVQNGQMVLVLVGRDLLGQLHTLKKELQELIVHGVDAGADLRKFHDVPPTVSLRARRPSPPQRRARRGARCRGRDGPR